MIYRIEMDGISIFSYSSELTLLDPALDISLNSGGSLEFTMPRSHLYYDFPSLMVSDIDVYEESNLIWFGRVSEIDVAMNRDKTVRCEGAIAFFNDSIQSPRKKSSISTHDLFTNILYVHNSQVSANRQISAGNVTVDNIQLSVESDYISTKDAIQQLCLDSVGGYLIPRKEDGVIYLDWLQDLTTYSSQPVEFGLNLVDISKHLSGTNLCTSIIPLGKEVDGEKVTIADVNEGVIYLDSDYIETFGRITRVVEFSEIASPSELLLAANRWLNSQKFDPIRIECEAAELHYLQPNSYSPFLLGQQVHVISAPHNVDAVIPVTSLKIQLDDPVKNVSIGIQEQTNITDYI